MIRNIIKTAQKIINQFRLECKYSHAIICGKVVNYATDAQDVCEWVKCYLPDDYIQIKDVFSGKIVYRGYAGVLQAQ